MLKRALHATHLLKLLDKMYKYEMDPMSIVEDTERTRFCPQTDRRTDGQTDKVIPIYFKFVEAGGIKIGHQIHRKHYITPNNLSLDLADRWNRNNHKKDTSSRGVTTFFVKSVHQNAIFLHRLASKQKCFLLDHTWWVIVISVYKGGRYYQADADNTNQPMLGSSICHLHITNMATNYNNTLIQHWKQRAVMMPTSSSHDDVI